MQFSVIPGILPFFGVGGESNHFAGNTVIVFYVPLIGLGY